MAEEDELDTKNLDKFIKALSKRISNVKIGILGGGARDDGKTNAEIGAIHEFGTSTMPQRSFLRVQIGRAHV